ncbi:putative P2Y purinoceptor 10 [Ornithorhynchus anatinus]|uniref:G-protein coupled receptors family 1 profile domain-containing protein n=1 Tax=Ornithorhynchus anatinus TaxID=9258 RepID=A0A6I8P163_ORNAN|nr:putative P2Y purinoceptor 10 [Ornithorhynchus anatinus]
MSQPTCAVPGVNESWVNETGRCSSNVTFQASLYAATYTVVFIPGLLANSTALWVLCRFVRQKNKAVIFMVNLSMADLAHVLSLPLRIYYYVNHHWPFPYLLCLLCFYLKYLNMYASICFLACISLQRCFFLVHPMGARSWRRRYDVAISTAIWAVVGTICLLFPLQRCFKPGCCFADLGYKEIKNQRSEAVAGAVAMVTVAELAGFLAPTFIIGWSTWQIRTSLQQLPGYPSAQEKHRALRLVYTCAAVFAICFTPYHLNFFFYSMTKVKAITNPDIRISSTYFHPFTLCLASLSCCLNPILYYFTTSEFREHLSRQSSSNTHSRLMSASSNRE